MKFEATREYARSLDEQDPLKDFRGRFHLPKGIYLCGNSLGLQPKTTRGAIEKELETWARLGVKGHFESGSEWLSFHERACEPLARIVGAKPIEVVAMNTLTVNLHLMMVSFYRPDDTRYKIVVEEGAFPSDQYAVGSQIEFHRKENALMELKPRAGEDLLREEDILGTLEEHGSEIALVVLGNVNYRTGQAYPAKAIAKLAKKKGFHFGMNLAHGAGNLSLELHDWDVDFAVWCSYKYLNAGPGGIACCFVHEKHARDAKLPRFAGWWGNNKEKRFLMEPQIDVLPGAEGWQLSNPPIFQLAALDASLQIFDDAKMSRIAEKRDSLTGYMEFLLSNIDGCQVITPKKERGSQLSLRVGANGKRVRQSLEDAGVVCDFREPDIVRATPVPLYNQFEEVFHFTEILKEVCHGSRN